MAANFAESAGQELRTEPRDEVHHRARATEISAGQTLHMLIVNMSPSGLMARCDSPVQINDRFRVLLPVAGARMMEVRWALGGRIGCRFEAAIPASIYSDVLAVMR